MSHFYAHLIVEIEPEKHFYIADEVQWGLEEDPGDGSSYELSRHPEFTGGPFPTQEAAIEAMVHSRGNPGWLNAMSFVEFDSQDEWEKSSTLEHLKPRTPDFEP